MNNFAFGLIVCASAVLRDTVDYSVVAYNGAGAPEGVPPLTINGAPGAGAPLVKRGPADYPYGECPTENAVCVIIRMRGPNPSHGCLQKFDEETCRGNALEPPTPQCPNCVIMGERQWPFDVIFPYEPRKNSVPDNKAVAHTLVTPAVDKAFACSEPGKQCQSTAMFAYGASGSGKSYTMGFGSVEGIMHLAVQEIFEKLAALQEEENALGDWGVYVTFFEIYGDSPAAGRSNNNVYDMLAKRKNLGHESQQRTMQNLRYFQAPDIEKFNHIANAGFKQRSVGGTGFNDESSRSHGIISVFLAEKTKGGRTLEDLSRTIATGNDKAEVSKARAALSGVLEKSVKLSFIDLAGSEPASEWNDVKKYPNIECDPHLKLSDGGCRALRVREGTVINIGLSQLAICIRSASGASGAQFCSTKVDMLTEMLKDLFPASGSNKASKVFTRMIVALNPSSDPDQMALSSGSLHYASDVKKIKMAPPKGVVLHHAVEVPVSEEDENKMAVLERRVAELIKENAELKAAQASDMRRTMAQSIGGVGAEAAREEAMAATTEIEICWKEVAELESQVDVLESERHLFVKGQNSEKKAREELEVQLAAGAGREAALAAAVATEKGRAASIEHKRAMAEQLQGEGMEAARNEAMAASTEIETCWNEVAGLESQVGVLEGQVRHSEKGLNSETTAKEELELQLAAAAGREAALAASVAREKAKAAATENKRATAEQASHSQAMASTTEIETCWNEVAGLEFQVQECQGTVAGLRKVHASAEATLDESQAAAADAVRERDMIADELAEVAELLDAKKDTCASEKAGLETEVRLAREEAQKVQESYQQLCFEPEHVECTDVVRTFAVYKEDDTAVCHMTEWLGMPSHLFAAMDLASPVDRLQEARREDARIARKRWSWKPGKNAQRLEQRKVLAEEVSGLEATITAGLLKFERVVELNYQNSFSQDAEGFQLARPDPNGVDDAFGAFNTVDSVMEGGTNLVQYLERLKREERQVDFTSAVRLYMSEYALLMNEAHMMSSQEIVDVVPAFLAAKAHAINNAACGLLRFTTDDCDSPLINELRANCASESFRD